MALLRAMASQAVMGAACIFLIFTSDSVRRHRSDNQTLIRSAKAHQLNQGNSQDIVGVRPVG
jgi:hypothetical protein